MSSSAASRANTATRAEPVPLGGGSAAPTHRMTDDLGRDDKLRRDQICSGRVGGGQAAGERGPGDRIVIVDDDPDVCATFAEYVRLHGFTVFTVHSGQALRRLLQTQDVDLVLLDLKLAGEDGLAVARYLRATTQAAIIMVTAVTDIADRIAGLDLGADDYLCKPVELREMLARMRSVLRRTHGLVDRRRADSQVPVGRRVKMGRVEFDGEARALVHEDGRTERLCRMESDLLHAFADNPGRVLSRDRLLDLANSGDGEPFDRSIDIRIARIRRKVEHDARQPTAIRTVRGAGYMFVPAPRV